MTVTNRGFRLHNVSGRVADIEIAADGLVTRTKSLVGSRLEIEAAGGDLSILADFAPSMTLPAESFRVAGEVEVLESGIGLHEVELGLGSVTGSADGRIVGLPTLDGTELRIAARGPSLAVIDPLVPQLILPDVVFSVSGAAGFADGRLELRQVAGRSCRHQRDDHRHDRSWRRPDRIDGRCLPEGPRSGFIRAARRGNRQPSISPICPHSRFRSRRR